MSTQPTSTPSLPDAATRLFPNLALTGKAGAGKDTVAEVLREIYPVYYRVAFADKLKEVAALIWGPSARTNREYLQKLGVAVREIDPDAWVTAALSQLTEDGYLHYSAIEAYRPPPSVPTIRPVVITDMRFPNEIRETVARGFVTVKVVADRGTRLNRLRDNGKLQDESQLEHVSETALDGYTADYTIINMDTREELSERLRTIVEHERQQRG